jgi:hypothetical protein
MRIVELLNAQPVLQQLIDRRMPGKLAYGLAKNIRMISQDLDDYDQARLKILGDNWTLDPKTNNYDIPEDDQKKWENLHNELIMAESNYQPFKIDIALIESIELTPGELITLWFIFDGSDLAPAGDPNNPAAAIDFP